MQWQDVRGYFPNQWVLLEAIEAHTQGEQRILDDLTVVQPFDDSGVAWKACFELQREFPQREFYVFHTDREMLNVRERVNVRT